MAISYGSACGPHCGYCGGCTSAYDRPNEPEPVIYCPCGQIVERVSVPVLVGDNQVIVCCSELCAADVQACERKASA